MFVQPKYERYNDTQAYLQRKNERDNATQAYLQRKGERDNATQAYLQRKGERENANTVGIAAIWVEVCAYTRTHCQRAPGMFGSSSLASRWLW